MKRGNNSFPQWLADEFNDNRSWSGLVTDLLTAAGPIKDNPATTFLLANGENFQPRPNIVAGTTTRLFWGVNLRCAECHNHPFAQWNQADFWGTAAFFGKVQFTGFKGAAASLTESISPPSAGKGKGKRPVAFSGTSIQIPAEAGKSSGKFVKARLSWATRGTGPRRERAVPTEVRRLGDSGRQSLLRQSGGQSDVGSLLRPRLRQPAGWIR